jgi:uncharacterized protein (TIGR04222 family)
MHLSGPKFLLVFVLVGVGVGWLLWLVRRWLEDGPIDSVDTSDPYRLALLRGGGGEAVRLAVVRLIDGGWLETDDDLLLVPESRPAATPAHPLERAVLDAAHARGRATVAQLGAADGVRAWRELTRDELRREGLLASVAVRWTRVGLAVAGALVLIVVASHRLDVAAQRGRKNTGLLETLRVLGPAAMAFVLVRGPRTRRGDRLLADLRTLVEKTPLPTGERGDEPLLSNETLLVAAVLGIAALPSESFAFARSLFPQARADGLGSGCGSSSGCGSTGGGDGGGGGGDGGGGGCGGGCGGCGGGCGG